MGCDAVRQQLCEQDIYSLGVPDYSSIKQLLQEVSDPQILYLSRCIVFEGQLVVDVLGSDGNRYHDLALYLTKLINKVELSA